MATPERRAPVLGDRRKAVRGGRRPSDRAGRSPALLLADSYEPVRTVYARFLDHHHFQIDVASTPTEIHASLDRARPAVALIAAELWGVPVWEMAEWPTLKGVPLIVLASVPDGGVDGAPSGRPFAPAAVLQKPFELSRLLEVVRGALRATPAG